MPILELKQLQKQFATQKAVDNVSFSIEEGTIFGLLGPNGAGKTTLLRMITGILYPDEGEIYFNGKPFQPQKDIRYIGYMPEERGLYKKMKVAEQAVYLAQLKGLSKSEAIEKTKEWFIRLEMQSWWNKKVEDLSKGMSQKLQFVTTVMHDPKLIILDEPFSGLDPVNSNVIKEEIYQLAKKGATVIFSTHRMEQVEEICQQIVLMNKGQKILDGTVERVKQDFKENLFRIGFSEPVEAGADAPFDILAEKDNGFIVKINEAHSPNDVLRYFMDRGAPIHHFHELLPSLNNIFIKLVEGTPAARQFL